MKQILKLTLLFPIFTFLISCGRNAPQEEDLGNKVEERTLNFYALNDFHGSFLYDASYKQTGFSRIGKFLNDKKVADPENTFLIASGDMFQGGAESNITYGEIVVKSMNAIGFDAMTIGNHEFDWGEDKIRSLQSKMDFPLLGFNIYYSKDNTRPDFLLPSTIIKKEGLKVGFIGAVQPNIGESILPTIAEQFVFPEQIDLIKNEAIRLKNNENCDIVIVSSHDGNADLYNDLSNKMNENETYIDALFLGHEHQKLSGTLDNNVPYIEGGSNGEYISNISLNLKLKNNHYFVESSSSQNIYTFNELEENFVEVDNIYNNYKDEIESIRDEVLYNFDSSVSKANFGSYISYSLLNYVNDKKIIEGVMASISIMNKGGVRDSIPSGEFTYGDLIKIYPFENALCILEVSKEDFNYYNSTTGYYKYTGDPVLIDGVYYIATIDYVAYKSNVPKNNIISFPKITCRDIVAETLKTKGYISL